MPDPKPKVRQYKKEVKNFLENNPGSNINDFNLLNQHYGNSDAYSDKNKNKQAKFEYKQAYQDYQKLIKSGDRQENIVESNVYHGKFDKGFSEYMRDQEIEYAYNKKLDPTNTDMQGRDSFYNNPIFRDRGGEQTLGIKQITDMVQSSRQGVVDGEEVNEASTIIQSDKEFEKFYSPRQVDWIEDNAEVLGLSTEDINKIRATNDEGMTGHGGSTSLYHHESRDPITGEHSSKKINTIDMPGYQGGSIGVGDKTWLHSSPMELQNKFEETNASVMNNPNLSDADKKAKLAAMSKDYIEKWKSGEHKVTSGRQIYEEEFKPAANQAITEARLQFQEEKDNIINNPDRIRNKFTLGGNK